MPSPVCRMEVLPLCQKGKPRNHPMPYPMRFTFSVNVSVRAVMLVVALPVTSSSTCCFDCRMEVLQLCQRESHAINACPTLCASQSSAAATFNYKNAQRMVMRCSLHQHFVVSRLCYMQVGGAATAAQTRGSLATIPCPTLFASHWLH